MGSLQPSNDSDIAIIGIGGRFPGAKTVEEFWQNLRNGVESLTYFSDDDMKKIIDQIPYRDLPYCIKDFSSPEYVKAGFVLDNVDQFDANFFGLTAAEAEAMDPQKRAFMECAWETLESAGYDPERYEGNIGCYAGVGSSGYFYQNLLSHPEIVCSERSLQVGLGNDPDYLTTRVSYKMNFRGPSLSLQTACSTSMVAIHLGCQSLLNGESDMVLAGGVVIVIPHRVGYLYREGAMYSPDGHCRAFSSEANGTSFTEGACGLVLLKRLSEAIKDKDYIYAVIKGTAVNNDGLDKAGFAAPSVRGQVRVVSEAIAVAQVPIETITYVEAHGTGTPLGDPIEVTALSQVFEKETSKKRFCALGSVKTNIGHAGIAAGVLGIIKSALCLRHGELVPSLHFHKPNPRIDLDNSPFYVNTQCKTWPKDDTPRRCGVSSFGIGGTNAHTVMEEPPTIETKTSSRPSKLIFLSAKTSTALVKMRQNLAQHLIQHPEVSLDDVAYTLQVGRQVFPYRCYLTCSTREQAIALLQDVNAKKVSTTQVGDAKARPVCFIFSGQGAQYVNMGKELYESEIVFRSEIDRCAEILQKHLGCDIRQIIYPIKEQEPAAQEKLIQTSITQPALFVIEYSLAKLWISWGIKPDTMIGHSIGEYIAACLAGVFSLEDALAVVAMRGKLMQGMQPGAMLAIPLPKEEVIPHLTADVSLATVNGPKLCVVSGTFVAIEELEKKFSSKSAKKLQTSHAFHSAMMDPCLPKFMEFLQTISLHQPKMPYYSNVSGKLIQPDECTNPEYWCKQLRQTVFFDPAIQELFKNNPGQVLLEVGPSRTLTGLLQRHPNKDKGHVVLSSIKHPTDPDTDMAFILETLGKLMFADVEIDWSGFYTYENRQKIPLPTYPFERNRYWIDVLRGNPDGTSSAIPGKKDNISDWFYLPSWKKTAYPIISTRQMPPQTYLVFMDDGKLGKPLSVELRRLGHTVLEVLGAEAFAIVEKNDLPQFSIRWDVPDDFDKVILHLDSKNIVIQQIIVLNCLSTILEPMSATTVADGLKNNFYANLYLAQALGKRKNNSDLRMTFISQNIYSITGQEQLCPENALLLGPCKVIPFEFQEITTRNIDVDQIACDNENLVFQVLTELIGNYNENVVAYRGKNRWVQVVEPFKLPEVGTSELPLRPEGVYVILGGLTGLGLLFAEHLAKSIQHVRLALLGRSTLPSSNEWAKWLQEHDTQDSTSKRIAGIQRLEKLGAKVLVIPTDVSVTASMQSAIQKINQEFGTIHGVIHSAGIAGGGLISLKEFKMAQSVLAPKVYGTLALYALLADMPLDFVLLFSSVIGFTGELGQVDYCSANAFMDAMGHYFSKNTKIRRVISVGWDGWLEVGMLADKMAQKAHSEQPHTAIHPLLGQSRQSNSQEVIYSNFFQTQRHWILQEHKIMGTSVIPGTSFLEMARQALQEQAGKNATSLLPVEFQEVFFISPIEVPEGEVREIRTLVQKTPTGFNFTIQSQRDNNTWQEYVAGRIQILDAMPKTHDLVSILNRCTKQNLVDNKAYFSDDTFMSFGPRWHNIVKAFVGMQEGVVELRLPVEFVSDLAIFPLHPALLDVATGVCVGLLQDANSSLQKEHYLPLSYKSIQVFKALPAHCFSHIQFHPQTEDSTFVYDVHIMDENGQDIVVVKDFTLTKVAISEVKSQPTHKVVVDVMQDGILPQEGIEAFRRLLAYAVEPHLVVCARDLNWVLQQYKKERKSGLDTVKHSENAAGDSARPELQSKYAPPRSDLEKNMVGIWQDVLKIPQVGIHDNFFELGGDSILVMQTIAKCKREGIAVAANQFMANPTIAELTQIISPAQPNTSSQTTIPAPAASVPTPTPNIATPHSMEAAKVSDFPEARIGQSDLEKLLGKLRQSEDTKPDSAK